MQPNIPVFYYPPAMETSLGWMFKLDLNSVNKVFGSPLVKMSANWRDEGT